MLLGWSLFVASSFTCGILFVYALRFKRGWFSTMAKILCPLYAWLIVRFVENNVLADRFTPAALDWLSVVAFVVVLVMPGLNYAYLLRQHNKIKDEVGSIHANTTTTFGR